MRQKWIEHMEESMNECEFSPVQVLVDLRLSVSMRQFVCVVERNSSA